MNIGDDPEFGLTELELAIVEVQKMITTDRHTVHQLKQRVRRKIMNGDSDYTNIDPAFVYEILEAFRLTLP